MIRLTCSALLVFLFCISLLQNAAVVAEGDEKAKDGDDTPPNFDMFNKNCPNYRCSKGLVPVPKTSRLQFTSAGCNAMSTQMITMAGNDDKKVYESCCDEWHACYQICGMSKKVCDESFQKCAEAKCGDDKDCTQGLSIQNMMLQLGGCKLFDQAQYERCECVKSQKTEKQRTAVLKKFYQKFAGEDSFDEKKIAGLVKKADSAAKMAGLMQKLIAKYADKAIKRVEDPQKKQYEEMMRKIKLDSEEKAKESPTEETGEEEEETGDHEHVEL